MNPTFLLSTAVGGVQGQVLGAILPSPYFFFFFYYPHSLSLFLQAVSLQKLPTDVNRGNQRCLRDFSPRVLPSALNSGGVVSSFTVFSAASRTGLGFIFGKRDSVGSSSRLGRNEPGQSFNLFLSHPSCNRTRSGGTDHGTHPCRTRSEVSTRRKHTLNTQLSSGVASCAVITVICAH